MAEKKQHMRNRPTQVLALLCFFVPIAAQASVSQIPLKGLPAFYHQTTFVVLVVMLCIMAVCIGVLAYRHRLLTKRFLNVVDELRKTRADAIKANNQKSLYLRSINHEVRTPLNAVVGFSRLLVTPGIQLTDNEREDFMRYIISGSTMLTQLIDDIITVSEFSNSQYQGQRKPCDSQLICETSLTAVDYRVQGNVELKLEYLIEPHTMIVADESWVRQVLANYLSNACKHTRQGRITLRCEYDKAPNTLLFSVADTGTGIEKGEAEGLFDRIKETENIKRGTGLGLFICKVIAQRLHGRVWCDTNYTGGARFCFSLPVEIVTPTEQQQTPTE